MALGVRDAKLSWVGYQRLTSLASSTALTVPAGAQYVLIKPETQAVRIMGDATAPTTTNGLLIDVGDEFWYPGELKNIRVIEVAASASCSFVYFR